MTAAPISTESTPYLRQAPLWRLLDDIYQGDTAWIDHRPDGTLRSTTKSRRYLPQEAGEADDEYEQRLTRSHFSDKFAQAIRDFVGVVFNNGVRLVEVPAPILADWANLDGSGMAGNRLCAQIGLSALRNGHSFVLVDYPTADESITSLADAFVAQRHPFWMPLSPLQVINWRYQIVANRKVLSMAVVRYQATESDGPFGEKERTYYLLLTPGRFDTFTVERDAQNRPVQVYHPNRSGPMGRRLRSKIEPFRHIPLVCLYGGDRRGFFESNPTLLSLAKLNLAHYQIKSDHRQKMHYCCFPTPVRVGGAGEDLTLGPRTIVDVPLGGSFGWSEPNANSLAMSRQELQDLEAEMDFLSVDYVVKPGDRQAAATSLIGAAKIESELYLFASDFALGITECLTHHARWLGLESGGRAELNTKFFENVAGDPQLLLAFSRLKELEVIDRDELRRLAADKKFFPETFELKPESKGQKVPV